jgi:excisionase family DNA binding protein
VSEAPTTLSGDRAGAWLREPLLDCAAAAALLNVRVSWVRDAAREGHLPSIRVGRHRRFTRAMLEEWLAEQFERPAGPAQRATVPARRVADRSAQAVFRRNTEASLLASLAQAPKPRRSRSEE